jgi:hypothetical protein
MILTTKRKLLDKEKNITYVPCEIVSINFTFMFSNKIYFLINNDESLY